jgi:hypothetical protein
MGLFWKSTPPPPPPPPRGWFGLVWDFKYLFIAFGVVAYSLFYQYNNGKTGIEIIIAINTKTIVTDIFLKANEKKLSKSL